jgi:hypothetical protein
MHAILIEKFMNDFKRVCVQNSLSVFEGSSIVAEMVPLHACESPEDEKLRHCRTCELLRKESERVKAESPRFTTTGGILG